MRRLLFSAWLVCLAWPAAAAEHMDVVQLELRNDCTVPQLQKLVQDFNSQWGKDNAYRAELAVPLQSHDLASPFWIGRSKNSQAFGKAWDAWRDAQSDANSTAAKLQARFDGCFGLTARRSYDVY